MNFIYSYNLLFACFSMPLNIDFSELIVSPIVVIFKFYYYYFLNQEIYFYKLNRAQNSNI